jgi:hypothetical protein
MDKTHDKTELRKKGIGVVAWRIIDSFPRRPQPANRYFHSFRSRIIAPRLDIEMILTEFRQKCVHSHLRKEKAAP